MLLPAQWYWITTLVTLGTRSRKCASSCYTCDGIFGCPHLELQYFLLGLIQALQLTKPHLLHLATPGMAYLGIITTLANYSWALKNVWNVASVEKCLIIYCAWVFQFQHWSTLIPLEKLKRAISWLPSQSLCPLIEGRGDKGWWTLLWRVRSMLCLWRTHMCGKKNCSCCEDWVTRVTEAYRQSLRNVFDTKVLWSEEFWQRYRLVA